MVTVTFHLILSRNVDPQASMDAIYYHTLAARLVSGQGLTEPFIWHHLREYTQIVRPIDYWQPFCIFFYAFIQRFFEPSAEVFGNYIIWGLLAVLVFRKISNTNYKKKSGIQYFVGAAWLTQASRRDENSENYVVSSEKWNNSAGALCAIFGFIAFSIAGKFAFFLGTTDNIAIYALLGFFFFELLEIRQQSWLYAFFLGVIGGIMAITRIEGVIFLGIAILMVFYKDGFSRGVTTVLGGMIILSPWMFRNFQVHGKIWLSNSQALFLRDYGDLFEPGVPLSLEYYFSEGWEWVLRHKIFSLQGNFLEMFILPTFVILFPFFAVGIFAGKRRELPFFGILSFFWLLNGILFTTQSLRGTALHNTAAFFPHICIFTSIGLQTFFSARKWKKPGRIGFLLLLAGWMVLFTWFGHKTLCVGFANENNPYRELLGKEKFSETDKIASYFPIHVYHYTKCQGIQLPSYRVASAPFFADEFDCNYILHDIRSVEPSVGVKNFPGWRLIASGSYLTLWGKISR